MHADGEQRNLRPRSDRKYTYTTAIVIIPPSECWEPIQEIRRRYDEKVRRWMPHVTLIYPFWPREQFPEAVEKLRAACGRVAPFEIVLARFDTFDHGRGRYTMWLDPEPADRLVELHRVLVEHLQISWGAGPFRLAFRPHLSVGQLRGGKERARVLPELQARWVPLKFTVREVALIGREEPPNDVFQVEQTIPLGSNLE